MDRQGRRIAWNRAIEEMSGAKKDVMLGEGGYAHAINRRNEDEKELGANVLANLKELILPFFEKLRHSRLDELQKTILKSWTLI